MHYSVTVKEQIYAEKAKKKASTKKRGAKESKSRVIDEKAKSIIKAQGKQKICQHSNIFALFFSYPSLLPSRIYGRGKKKNLFYKKKRAFFSSRKGKLSMQAQ